VLFFSCWNLSLESSCHLACPAPSCLQTAGLAQGPVSAVVVSHLGMHCIMPRTVFTFCTTIEGQRGCWVHVLRIWHLSSAPTYTVPHWACSSSVPWLLYCLSFQAHVRVFAVAHRALAQLKVCGWVCCCFPGPSKAACHTVPCIPLFSFSVCLRFLLSPDIVAGPVQLAFLAGRGSYAQHHDALMLSNRVRL
jgi:hypothetical protein